MNQNSRLPSFSRIRNLVFLGVFFIILVLPAIIKLPPPSDFQTQPGNFLSAHPALRAYWFFTQLPGDYRDYFSNHFFLRDQGVTWNNHILSQLGSNIFHDVLIGKNGWLYLTDEENIRYYQCDQPFTREELDRLVKKVMGMRNFSRENGADFLLVVAPDKESIYPEFLPDGIQNSGNACRMDQALQALRGAGLTVPDLRASLQELKAKSQVYYKTDTHWNDAGSFQVYQTISTEMKKLFPTLEIWSPSDFKAVQEEKSGDLSHLIPLVKPITETTMVLEPIRQRKAVISQGTDSKTIISESGISSNPNAVIFRDSFFMGLLPFFAENFNRAVYRWSFDFDHDLIRSEKPDIVFYEIAERYLGNLAQ